VDLGTSPAFFAQSAEGQFLKELMNSVLTGVFRSRAVKLAVAVCAGGLFFSRIPAARADTDSDRDFVRQAVEEVLGDAAINRLVHEKAEHEDVRHFADVRVRTDKDLEAELRDIADRHHIGVPGKGELAQRQQDKLDSLRSSLHFDREYLSGEVRDSEEMRKLFRSASEGASDPDLRHWFRDKEDTLRDQHEAVSKLDAKFDR
jgi:predicted outer membrane protein